jgi:hypothetical protein
MIMVVATQIYISIKILKNYTPKEKSPLLYNHLKNKDCKLYISNHMYFILDLIHWVILIYCSWKDN